MGYGNDDGGQTHDGYPRKTSAGLAVKDKSSVTSGPLKSEAHANSLIDLVLAGEDPSQIMSDAIAQIDEGQGGGPYPIGSGVKVNTATTAEKVGGGSVSLKQGDTVYIVQTNLGEKGTDKMVLLSDGTTKVVVPLAALGESVLGEADIYTGPSGHAVPPATGKETVKPSVAQGDKQPGDVAAAQTKGSTVPSSHPSTAQGDKAPTDDTASQKAGSGTAAGLNPSKAVEARAEVVQNLDMMLDDKDITMENYKRVNEMRRKIEALNPERHADTIVIAGLHGMLFDKENEYAFDKLEAVAETGDRDEKNGKKNPFGGMKNAMKKDEAHNNDDKKKNMMPPEKKKDEADNGNGNGANGNGKDDKKDKKPNPFAKKMEGLPAIPVLGAIQRTEGGNGGGMQPTQGGKKDKPIPQGKPGNNKDSQAPGLTQEGKKSGITSIISRMDESTQINLEGGGRQFR